MRRVAAVIGAGEIRPDQVEMVRELGRRLVDAGFRVVTGGRGGVMLAASAGARESLAWREGDVVAILPGYDRAEANPYADIVIPTGIGIARNVIVVSAADVVIAYAGGSGTMSEIALAWQLGKPVIALGEDGWAGRIAGTRVDERRGDVVHPAATPEEAVALAVGLG